MTARPTTMRKAVGIIIAAFCSFIAAFTEADEYSSASGDVLLQIDGLVLRRQQIPGRTPRVMYSAWIDVGKRDPRVSVPGEAARQVEQRALGATGLTVRDYVFEKEAVVALSGGYVGDYFLPIPVGYLQVEGIPLNRRGSTRVLNGIFCSSPGQIVIDMLSDHFDPETWRDCLQAGPLLILAGKEVLSEADPQTDFVTGEFERAFVGVDERGQAVLAVTEPIQLDELSALLASGKLGAFRAVMNLPGSGSAGLAWRAPDGTVLVWGYEAEFLADAITVR